MSALPLGGLSISTTRCLIAPPAPPSRRQHGPDGASVAGGRDGRYAGRVPRTCRGGGGGADGRARHSDGPPLSRGQGFARGGTFPVSPAEISVYRQRISRLIGCKIRRSAASHVGKQLARSLFDMSCLCQRRSRADSAIWLRPEISAAASECGECTQPAAAGGKGRQGGRRREISICSGEQNHPRSTNALLRRC